MTISLNTNRMRVSATGRMCPAQCPEPAARTHIPFDQPPSLHLLRAALRRQFVRRLRQYYAAVRLPAPVHHRRTSLDFTMRPKRARLGWSQDLPVLAQVVSMPAWGLRPRGIPTPLARAVRWLWPSPYLNRVGIPN